MKPRSGIEPTPQFGRIAKTAIGFLVSAGISSAFAAERPPEQQLRVYLASRTERGNVFAQGALDHVDYRKLLHAAVAKDSLSLAGIFQYTAKGTLWGEGAESNGDILRQLLRLWGDAAYARVLAAEPPKVRAAVISALDSTWPYPGWQPKEFSTTYHLAKHAKRQ